MKNLKRFSGTYFMYKEKIPTPNPCSIMRGSALKMQNQTFMDVFQYSLATIFSAGMALMRSLALPFLFLPAQMGIWNLMKEEWKRVMRISLK